MANKVFGIDLGTTYSCISFVDQYDQPVIAHNLSGNPTTPSVVMFNADGSYIAGEEAKRSGSIAPDRVVSLVKRHMGDSNWRFSVDDKQFTASEVSSKILEALVQDANKIAGEDVQDVVITVPAYFGMAERDATRLAGQIAGLNVVDIINEPTAAAFTYGFGKKDAGDETVLVYDLGGGTFDVTVMVISGGNIRVVATDGDPELGGDNWDQRLVEIVRGKFMDENPDADDPLFDPSAMAGIQLECEEAKRKLSTTQSARLRAMSGATMAMIEVTREEFEDVTRELLSQTVTKTKACLDAAKKLGVSQIDRILLVGGSSIMPAVATRLRGELGIEPQLQEPHLAVAKGAALWGQKAGITAKILEYLKGQGHDVTEDTLDEVTPEQLNEAAADVAAKSGLRKDAVIKLATTKASNVCSQGFGVEYFDEGLGRGVVGFMIHRNDQLPASHEDTFYTRVDDTPWLEITVWEQGTDEEDQEMDVNNEYTKGKISPLPPGYPRGTPVTVRFEMSNSGTLVVTARHPGAAEPLVLKEETGRGTTAEEVAQSIEQMSSISRRV